MQAVAPLALRSWLDHRAKPDPTTIYFIAFSATALSATARHTLTCSWDTKCNGTLDTSQLRGALRTLNMRLSATQAKEVSR